MTEKIQAVDWSAVAESLNEKGYAHMPRFLPAEDCAGYIARYNTTDLYRKTVTMERYRFGRGEYKYFRYPLPAGIQTLREELYPQLAPVANAWMSALNDETRFPDTLEELRHRCHAHGQTLPTPLILKYGPGGFNTLHQDIYGEVFFPLQPVLFLNDPDTEYTGGEFVLTQQNPRAQSQATVLRPGKGDLLIFTTRFRPVRGSKGYYRVQVKHGVSEVHTGERHTLGIIFHDAVS